MSRKDSESNEQYLRRKGWVQLRTLSAWCWQLPPLPARYMMQDAMDVQRGLDSVLKTKGKGITSTGGY